MTKKSPLILFTLAALGAATLAAAGNAGAWARRYHPSRCGYQTGQSATTLGTWGAHNNNSVLQQLICGIEDDDNLRPSGIHTVNVHGQNGTGTCVGSTCYATSARPCLTYWNVLGGFCSSTYATTGANYTGYFILSLSASQLSETWQNVNDPYDFAYLEVNLAPTSNLLGFYTSS